jgi:peroxiredoxin family protein
MIAVILASGRLERIYTALALLVSAAAEGDEARGLVTFEALEPMLDAQLHARALRRDETPALSEPLTLVELRATAAELPNCRIWACAAAVETTRTARADVEAQLDGVLSTPRFLREIGDARLVVV